MIAILRFAPRAPHAEKDELHVEKGEGDMPFSRLGVAYMAMAYILMAYILMAYIVMAYIVMAFSRLGVATDSLLASTSPIIHCG